MNNILTMTIVSSEAMSARREAIATQLDEVARSIDKRRSGEACILLLRSLMLTIDQKYFLCKIVGHKKLLVRPSDILIRLKISPYLS